MPISGGSSGIGAFLKGATERFQKGCGDFRNWRGLTKYKVSSTLLGFEQCLTVSLSQPAHMLDQLETRQEFPPLSLQLLSARLIENSVFA